MPISVQLQLKRLDIHY